MTFQTLDIDSVREKLVDAVLVACAILMVPTAILSWFRVYTIGVQPIMFVETAFAIGLVLVALLRTGLSLTFKSLVIVGLSFTMAIMGLLMFGLVSRATDTFIMIAVLMTTLLGRRWGWWSVGVTTAVAGIAGVGFASGWLTYRVDLGQYASSPMTWVFSLTIVAFLSAVAITIIGGVYEALQESIRSLQGQAVELAEARDIAEAANRSKSAFMANVSHEFRTPLNAIVGYAEMHQANASDDRVSEDMERVALSGRSLARLVESILELSRLEAGDLELQPVPMDVATFLAAYLPRYAQIAEQKGLTFSFEADPDTPSGVVLDEVRIGKVLEHLVDNAIKFTESGAIEVRASGRQTSDEWAELTIRVTDTGKGIPVDQLQQVMQPFTQQDGQQIGQYDGTGIGLSLARRTTELLGGRLEVKSDVGTGSEFAIQFDRVAVERI